jgi:hypothetical protein
MTTLPVPPTTTPVPATPWPADVLKFAAEHGVAEYLEPMLEATRRVFPTARLIEVRFDRDPEYSGYDGILFLIHVSARDIPDSDVVRVFRAWHEETFQCCPAPLVCNFLLRLAREES